MVEGLPLGSYLLLVDYTGRLFREGKSAMLAELAGILARLGTSRGKLGPAGEAEEVAGCWAGFSQPAASGCGKWRAFTRPPPGQPGRLPGT